jgi:hypothetical protein
MILLIGSEGSIGRRYKAVLEELNLKFREHDLAEMHRFHQNVEGITHAIIASPTPTHFGYCLALEKLNIPYLCEKPVTKNILEAERLYQECTRGFVVNNWAFLGTNADLAPSPTEITYDFYNTGRDGLLWDVCQLIYLAHVTGAHLTVSRISATWDVTWNGVQVPYSYIENSYIQMVRAFIEGDTKMLWSLRRGCEMTKLVSRLEEQVSERSTCEGFVRDPGKDEFHAFSGKNLRKNRRQVAARMGLSSSLRGASATECPQYIESADDSGTGDGRNAEGLL